jgi:hypothetical protein
VPEASTPVPAWFAAFAETVAGLRLSERGNVELVPRHELESARDQLATANASDFYARLAQWFLADPSKRPSAPF